MKYKFIDPADGNWLFDTVDKPTAMGIFSALVAFWAGDPITLCNLQTEQESRVIANSVKCHEQIRKIVEDD